MPLPKTQNTNQLNSLIWVGSTIHSHAIMYNKQTEWYSKEITYQMLACCVFLKKKYDLIISENLSSPRNCHWNYKTDYFSKSINSFFKLYITSHVTFLYTFYTHWYCFAISFCLQNNRVRLSRQKAMEDKVTWLVTLETISEHFLPRPHQWSKKSPLFVQSNHILKQNGLHVAPILYLNVKLYVFQTCF